jgi:hypothetical protein
MIKLYIETLPVLQRAFALLESKIEKPAFVSRGSYKVFRYKKQSIEAAVIQKLARIISGLHASLMLLSGGFVQELGVIFRTMDEFNEDILFLCQAIRTGEVTELHRKYLEDFYQEEFDEPDNPFLSEQKRSTIPRRKIHAAIANIPETTLNPSDGKELYRTLSQAYSGYIHGASVHIMDMYGGNPPRFHVAGMLNTPRIKESTADLWNYFYRGLISTMIVALSFKENELLKKLYSFRDYFEKKSGKTTWDKPEAKIKNLKNKNAQQKNRGDRD